MQLSRPLRVGMLRLGKVGRRQLLDDPAGIHDDDAVAEGRDQPQIVRDEDQPHAALAHQPVEDAQVCRAAPSRRAPRSARRRSAVPARRSASWRSWRAGPCRRRPRADRGRRRVRGRGSARLRASPAPGRAPRPCRSLSCVRSVSTICRPMLITGFERVFRILQDHGDALAPQPPALAGGGCRAGRCRRIRASLAEMSALGGVSPMMARPVCDLPEPDSPTMPSRSRPSVKEMPRTASITPVRVGKRTLEIVDGKQRRSLLAASADRARRAVRRRAG